MRLFLGVELTEYYKELELLQKKFDSVIDASFIPKEKFHLSINFVGKKDPVKVAKKINKVNQKIFEATTANLGIFPNINNPKVLFIGVEPYEELRSLHTASNIALGIKSQEYVPHITIARIKEIKDKEKFIQLLNQEQPKVNFLVNKFSLFSSHPSSIGHIYTRIKDYHLRKE